ncbi:unnamed protein product, partial [Mesorhabditis belari]|uniref:Uncharacterized protein n=1 Tax=Mesorhabditis belari TaxID=2138241 RepID=A0AAF3EDS9_9BILA
MSKEKLKPQNTTPTWCGKHSITATCTHYEKVANNTQGHVNQNRRHYDREHHYVRGEAIDGEDGEALGITSMINESTEKLSNTIFTETLATSASIKDDLRETFVEWKQTIEGMINQKLNKLKRAD